MKPLRHAGRVLSLAAVALGLCSLGGDCDGDLVTDPTFRDWCGESLCDWTLDAGHIKAVPTWSTSDLGVSFEDTPTEISQVTWGNNASCILFTTVANIAPSAQVVVQVDFDNDGHVDYEAPLGAAEWQKVQSEITAPAQYDGATFRVRKQGQGTAVLAEMRIQSTTGCTAPAPTLTGTPLGDVCSTDAECESRVCEQTWAGGICAECSENHECPRGEQCGPGLYLFDQCAPGQRKVASGEACTTGADCQSGVCDGVEVLDDGGLPFDASACWEAVPATGADAASADSGAYMLTCGTSPYPVRGGRCH